MIKKILTLALLIGITQMCFSQINWKNDIDTLKSELPKKHKNFFFLKSEHVFNSGLEGIKNQCDSLSGFEITIKLQQLIAKFGDSHTRLDLFSILKPELNLPIGMYLFTDGVYILKANPEYASLIGKRLININGHPIEEVIDSVNTLITCENDALRKEIFPQIITSTQLLDYFKFSSDSTYYFEVEVEDGKLVNQQIYPSKIGKQFISIQRDSLPYCWQERRTAFTKRYFEDAKILYISYNSCAPVSYIQNNGNTDTLLFEDFQKQIFDDLKHKNVKKLIFDMRFNGGGNSIYGTRFVNKLSGENIDKKGKIFVVIGRSTFSSAILNTVDFENKTNAITVGEETGGKPNHYGEIRSFKLPNSNLDVIYSTKYFKNTEKEINTIVPYIKIETSFQDFKRGIDPVYEWIKKQNMAANSMSVRPDK